MFRASALTALICFVIWIMPFGIFLESIPVHPISDHTAPSGCLCTGSSGKTAKYTKYLLQDACRGKPLSKFGGAAHNDLFVFTDESETLLKLSAYSFQYSFLYDYRLVPPIEHVPKTTLS